MDYAYYERRIETDTTGRYDVTPLFGDPDVFASLACDLLQYISVERGRRRPRRRGNPAADRVGYPSPSRTVDRWGSAT